MKTIIDRIFGYLVCIGIIILGVILVMPIR